MAIEKANWDDAIRSLPNMGYQHPRNCLDQIKEVRSMFPDIEPYVATLPTRECLLLMKGTLLPAPSSGGPAVCFVVTLQHPFPNSYPILTVEEPKAPWRVKNHPNVDTSGQTYLGSVSQWNPTSSKMLQCCQELQTALLSNYPFENAQQARGPAPPAAQPLNHQPAPSQSAPPPQPVQQQRQPVHQPQQSYQRRQDLGGHTDEYDVARAVARGTVAAATTTVALFSAAVDAGNAMTGGGSRTQPRSTTTHQQQQQQPRNYQGRQLNQAQAQQERMKQDFILLMQGKISVAPGTEILCPRGFGPSAFMTSKTNIDAGLLTPGQAPLPGPACMEPTPEEHHKQALEKQKLEQQRADVAASQDKKSGAGWKALSAVGRFAGKAASKAKNAVEDKVRESSFEGDKKKFASEFPEDAAGQQLIMQYECSCLSGDGVSRPGHIYICEKRVYFSGVFESKASKEAQQQATEPVPFKFCILYEKLVSVMKGEACGKKFLHLFTEDGSFRSFLSFKDSTASMIGSYASVSMSSQGDTYNRCWNWLDHTWRKATLVPSPTYHYYGQAGPLGYPQGYQPGQPTPVVAPSSTTSPAGYPTTSGATTTTAGVPVAPAPAPAPLKTGLYDAPAPQDRAVPLGGSSSAAMEEEKEPAELPEGRECCVCLEAPKNAFFQPCGHVACCLKCANQIDVCPICRGKIMQVFPAFI